MGWKYPNVKGESKKKKRRKNAIYLLWHCKRAIQHTTRSHWLFYRWSIFPTNTVNWIFLFFFFSSSPFGLTRQLIDTLPSGFRNNWREIHFKISFRWKNFLQLLHLICQFQTKMWLLPQEKLKHKIFKLSEIFMYSKDWIKLLNQTYENSHWINRFKINRC